MSSTQPSSGENMGPGSASGALVVHRGGSRARHRLFCSLLAALCLLPAFEQAAGQDSTPTEYEVKAAFLFNFVKFVDWPQEAFPQPGAPIIVGIVGRDLFGTTLDLMLNGKTVQGRSFVVKRFATAEEIDVCHVLFIGSSEPDDIQRVLKVVGRRSVLTVGDTEALARQGGIIGFRMENTMVRFDINTEAADRARLRVDSRLLSLARVIRTMAR